MRSRAPTCEYISFFHKTHFLEKKKSVYKSTACVICLRYRSSNVPELHKFIAFTTERK